MTRVISGSARGRRLAVPEGTATRPTSDRAREALFSSLLSLLDLEQARVLDLYAGSGALGLEALSRGAASATLVEHDPAAVAVLRDNVGHLGLPGAHVVAVDVERWLAVDPEARYDLALLDPPYELDGPELAQVLVGVARRCEPEAVVVVERSARSPEPVWPEGLDPLEPKTYGETQVWFAERVVAPPVASPA